MSQYRADIARYRPAVAVAAAASLLLISLVTSRTASAAETGKGVAKRGGVLEFAVDAEPPNYDCHANFSFVFIHPVIPHYSTLLKFDTANYPQVVGDLAESWTVSTDRRTYTFKLRPNVFFHDGAALTSADVKASYERIIHPPQGVLSARQADYAAITSIDTPDPKTAVFHLQWPDAAMLANFASPWNCIYRAAKLAEDPNFPKTHVLGTGPFAFVEYQPQQFVKLAAHKAYFRGAPQIDTIVYRYIPSDATRDLAFRSGEIDMMFGRQTNQWVERTKDVPGAVVVAMEPAELNALVETEIKSNEKLIKGAGLKPN